MNIRFKMKPSHIWNVPNKTYFSLRSKINNVFRDCDGSYYSWNMVAGSSTIYGLVFEKHRKKINITKKKNKGVGTGKSGNSFRREVVSPAHWIVKCYSFDPKFLKMAGLQIVQHARHFDIVSAKK